MKEIGWQATALVVGLLWGCAGQAAGEADDHRLHYQAHGPHHLSVFFGVTEIDEEELDTAFTLGLDYEYRVSRLLGVGAVTEHAFGALDATSVLAVVDVHIVQGFALQVGTGVEFSSEDDVAIGRVGGLYETAFGAYTVAPQIHDDIHDKHKDALVFGLALGRAF